jgi:hypothetical protein
VSLDGSGNVLTPIMMFAHGVDASLTETRALYVVGAISAPTTYILLPGLTKTGMCNGPSLMGLFLTDVTTLRGVYECCYRFARITALRLSSRMIGDPNKATTGSLRISADSSSTIGG